MSNVTPINPDNPDTKLASDLTTDPWDDTPDGIEPPPLIPQGEYHVAYVLHEYFEAFDNHKARVPCEITKGEFAGLTLDCFYNVRRENKCYHPAKSKYCHYRIDMLGITGSPTANLTSLRGLDLIATVETVTRDSRGKLALSHQYSVIRQLRKA